MQYLSSFTLPILLGLAAAVTNYVTMAIKIRPESFVSVTRDIRIGDLIKQEDLAPVELSGDLGTLAQTAVPWSDKAILYDVRVSRNLAEGDIVLKRDRAKERPRLEAAEDEVLLHFSLDKIANIPDLIYVGDEISFVVDRSGSGSVVLFENGDNTPEVGNYDPDERLDYLGPYRVVAMGTRVSDARFGEMDGEFEHEKILTVADKLLPGTKKLDESTSRLLRARDRRGSEQILGMILHGPQAK